MCSGVKNVYQVIMSQRTVYIALFCFIDVLVFVVCSFAFMLMNNKFNPTRFNKPVAYYRSKQTTSTKASNTPEVVVENETFLLQKANTRPLESLQVSLSSTDFKPCYQKNGECRRRLPQAIVIGVKKCGTGTLRYFLKVHPQVVFSRDEEIHYFNVPSRHDRGIEWYRRQMSLSRSKQITMEKTPRYFVSSAAPLGIYNEVSPKTKIIVLLRNPVKRAVSDYIAVKHTEGLTPPKDVNVTGQVPPYVDPIYDIKPSFERSVLDQDGNVKEWNGLINIGMYSNHMKRWLAVFPKEQILVIDSETITQQPWEAIAKVERFLGLTPYFNKEHFYFSAKKGFYCLKRSGKVSCQGASKGRKHPDVDQDVLEKLRTFYRPYDEELSNLLQQRFSWFAST